MERTNLEHLNVFSGKWLTHGMQHAGPVGAEARIDAVETYEWLPGEQFMIHRFDGHVGDSSAACLEVIGRDAANDEYPVRTYYHSGVVNEWHLHEREGSWLLTGHWNVGGSPADVRCTTVFSDDGSAMAGKWEYSRDGSDWETFWEVEGRRQQ